LFCVKEIEFSPGCAKMPPMSYVRKYKRGDSTYVQLVFKNGRKISKVVHLGTAHNQQELDILLNKAHEMQIDAGQQSLFPNKHLASDLLIESTASKLLYSVILDNFKTLRFDSINNELFQHLVIARIVEPVSKLDSIRVLKELGINEIPKDQIYRALLRIKQRDYRKIIEQLCREKRKINNGSILLYDVTTLYFEIPAEDGKRVPGLSKERRLEPQIVIGLLVDQKGFPLSLQMFSGNTAETKTIVPVLESFRKEYGIKKITVVADAAMLNQGNIKNITDNGFNYIIGSRQHKMPFAIEEYFKVHKTPVDLAIVESVIVKDGHDQRAIYQYSAKRAKLDLHNIEKQVKKAKNIVAGIWRLKKNKFVRLDLNKKNLNQALIEKAKALAGFKGYITNLNLPALEIISHYHDLWHVEAAFRMSKSDLKARPIFHHKEDSIEAHLTIVMAGMAVAKIMEEKSGMAIKKIVKLLKPLRTAILINTSTGLKSEISPFVPPDCYQLIEKLSRGY
jgi:hypothetical protein